MSLDDFELFTETPANPAAPAPRKCRRHEWALTDDMAADSRVIDHVFRCVRCGVIRNDARARLSRNNRKRGGAAELDVARTLGARKVGPLGLPWDVEMAGYARLQVRKYLRPESLRKIAAELARIGSGEEMPGYVWIEPGRGGEQLIVFRLRDFAERHGIPELDDAA